MAIYVTWKQLWELQLGILAVIEDTQAVGASYLGSGQVALAQAFSAIHTKNIMSGEGG
jgi:dTDP-4-amino-4,6-dideoxygalactose transaminase